MPPRKRLLNLTGWALHPSEVDDTIKNQNGIKAARVVRKFGVRLVPKLYAHLNPMSYAKAVTMEGMLAESLRRRDYVVYGGH